MRDQCVPEQGLSKPGPALQPGLLRAPKGSWTSAPALPIFLGVSRSLEESCRVPRFFASWMVGAPAADAATQTKAADAANSKKASPSQERRCETSCVSLHLGRLGLADGSDRQRHRPGPYPQLHKIAR